MKISELANLVGVAPSTIRYYEGKGLLPKGNTTIQALSK
jgi:DNA-binding transcriptional MerR regulator